MADDRTYIRVHDGIYEHPKVIGLSDAAFRLLIQSWCYCSRNLTDGHVTDAAWKRLGSLKARRELIGAGLAVQSDGSVAMHDYLEHQRSAEEVAEYKAKKKAAGAKGNHTKHHVEKGRVDPECTFCQSPDGSQRASQVRPQVRSQTPRKTVASTETETETYKKNSSMGGSHVSSSSADEPPRCSQHKGMAREQVPNCWACGHKREQWEMSRTTDFVFDRAPWCGDDECNPMTRLRDTGIGVIRCPECHPLANEEAS